MMIEMKRSKCPMVLLWLLAALLALVLAACGQPADAGIPSATGNQGTGAGSTTPTPTPVDEMDMALAYAQCIRDNGFPEWPDPNADGQFVITRGASGQGGFGDPRRTAAMEACQHLRPAGAGGGGVGDPEERLEMMLAFAQCMRDNGVPEFPDPEGSGQMVFSGPLPFNPNSPTFQAAQQACAGNLQGGMMAGGGR